MRNDFASGTEEEDVGPRSAWKNRLFDFWKKKYGLAASRERSLKIMQYLGMSFRALYFPGGTLNCLADIP